MSKPRSDNPMFFSRSNGTTHFLAVASATTAVVGLGFDDLKWLVTIAASLFGSAVALYIFRGEMRASAQARDQAQAEFDRLRALYEAGTDLPGRDKPGSDAKPEQ
jgi:hypothetical protein